MRYPFGAKETARAAGKDSDGEKANPPGPGASCKSSGFGGLGLEGIVGMEESAGEGEILLTGVGNNGEISGDKAGAKDGNGA